MKQIQTIGIVGAGAMGRGIAQISAQAGYTVLLTDANEQAVVAARAYLDGIWGKLVAKGKMSADAGAAALQRVVPCTDMGSLGTADLIIEAVVERLNVKQELFATLENMVAPDCILATNTSSLSITAIASVCKHPERVAGCHFFNPVALMKVAEVVDGLHTDASVCRVLAEFISTTGHTPVHARDMPGFIVNHAGRGMNTEGLRVAQEAVAPFDQVDAIMREQAGFRMGPFELLDLTGLDVSHPVMEAIYRQFYDEPRFRPSPITAIRLAGGMLGRKSGEGFYRYVDGKKQLPEEPSVPGMVPNLNVWVAPYHQSGYACAAKLLEALPVPVAYGGTPPDDALILVTPFGEDVSTVVAAHHLDGTRTVGLDTLFGLDQGRRRVVMCSPATHAAWRDAAHALMAADDTAVSVINDSAGFVAQRMVATIVNVACDIAQQAIATPQDIDKAVSLGLGYPCGGPLSMGDALGSASLLEVLRAMYKVTGDSRYRPSLWMQRRVQLGLSLLA